jgi:hypothetical protein
VKLPFKRNNTEPDILPSEVKEYYQSERRERVGVAWLLALGTLILTLILASGLFFGGRWAYRKLAGKDRTPVTTQEQPAEDTPASGTQGSTTNGQSSASGPTGTSSTSTSTPSGSGVAPASTTASGNLPNTGPGEVLGLATATTVAGTVAHAALWARRNSRQ